MFAENWFAVLVIVFELANSDSNPKPFQPLSPSVINYLLQNWLLNRNWRKQIGNSMTPWRWIDFRSRWLGLATPAKLVPQASGGMAAGQVAFRSESISPALISSTVPIAPRHSSKMNTTKMTTSTKGTSSKNVNSSPNPSNNGNNHDLVNGLASNRGNNLEGITNLMAACQEGRQDNVQQILKKKVSQFSTIIIQMYCTL